MVALKDNPKLQSRWKRLEDSVSGLERNMKDLTEVLREEEAALADLRVLEREAKERRSKLRSILAAQNREANQKIQQKNSVPSASRSEEENETEPGIPAARKDSFVVTTIERVTQAEMNTVPRAMRSNISLAAVNDAVSDMEELLTEASRSGRRKPLSQLDEKHSHKNNPMRSWVTEQEMRQFCSFFRHGESSARATLLILRNLHRLQQVPGKHGEFLYFVP